MNAQTETRHGYRRIYKNHGDGKIGYWEGWVEAPNKVIMQHAKTLDGKVVRQVYEAKGKNIGRANETLPLEQAVLELESRTKKKLDKGYVWSVDDAKAPATNTLDLAPPMLATPLEKVEPESIDWSEAFVQPKLDGHRALFKDGVLYSRGGKEIHLPHIVEAIKASGLNHLHLDGEIYLHGLTLQQISKLAKKHYEPGEALQPGEAGKRGETIPQGTKDLEYHVYDRVHDAHWRRRIQPVIDAHNLGKPHPAIEPVDTYLVTSMQGVLEKHSLFRNLGYEGTMLRFGSEPYRTGKRSRALLKIKEFRDEEFTILDVEEGKPYIRKGRTFQVPVWVCDAGNGKTFTVTAQGNMHEKTALWDTRAEHIGKELTVKYHYLSADGIPQLPVALRFHETI